MRCQIEATPKNNPEMPMRIMSSAPRRRFWKRRGFTYFPILTQLMLSTGCAITGSHSRVIIGDWHIDDATTLQIVHENKWNAATAASNENYRSVELVIKTDGNSDEIAVVFRGPKDKSIFVNEFHPVIVRTDLTRRRIWISNNFDKDVIATFDRNTREVTKYGDVHPKWVHEIKGEIIPPPYSYKEVCLKPPTTQPLVMP